MDNRKSTDAHSSALVSFAAASSDSHPHSVTQEDTGRISHGEAISTALDYTVRDAVAPASCKRVLIVGWTELARRFAACLQNDAAHRYQVAGFVDDENYGSDVLGNIGELLPIVRRHFVDDVVVAKPVGDGGLSAAIEKVSAERLNVFAILESGAVHGTEETRDTLCGFPVAVLHREKRRIISIAIKRCLDVLGATMGLLVLSPVFAAVALLVAIDSGTPILYAHTRVGRKGRQFTCYKFRTMVVDADALKEQLRHLNELGNGFFFKIGNDPRVTRVGRYLRRYSLDELPQLFNVLRGDMSLVGPRPSPVDEFAMYAVHHLRRLDVTPGITGLWQIQGRRSPDFDRAMSVDLEYVNRWNIWLDLAIIGKTFGVIFQGE